MTKVIDNSNLGYLISKIKSAFLSKTDVVQIGLDDTPTANSNNLVKSGGVKSALDAKQDTLVSGTNIKTINNQSLLGSGNISISGDTSGEANVIETIKVNGTALTPDSNKAVDITVPSAVTESTVSGWGFTKNTGTYSKPSGGIPATDLATAVQTSLGKADTALQSYTETDPTVPSHVKSISASDISNWNSKTSNTGTITGITMNGTSKGTSGVVDLGTVLTSYTETDPTVPAWAKASTKPTYTASEVGALPSTGGTLSGDLTVSASESTEGVTVHYDGASTVYGAGQIYDPDNDSTYFFPSSNGTLALTSNIPTVNNNTITIQKGGTTVDSFTTNASAAKTINIPNELPSYSSSNSGNVLSVNSSGQLVWITPAHIYSGSSTPDANTGNNGDIYLQS